MASALTPDIRNIIFDLGDVIVPIDLRAPIRNFAQLANLPIETVEALWKEHGLWQQYETGLVDDAGFRQHVRALLKNDTWTDDAIDLAWNTVLLDLPVERIERIGALKDRYRLFLLSNTNAIHIRQVDQMLAAVGQPPLAGLFERVFLSHELKMAKPAPDIFHYVLQTAGLAPGETLFLDDNGANIQAAAALGIRAVQVVPPLTIIDYLS